MAYSIALIPGDGIGPDIIAQAVAVLNAVGAKYNHEFLFTEADAGGIAIDKYGEPLPQKTLDTCRASDAVLLGAVGGPKWDDLSGNMRPEKALLGLRGGMDLYANLRPVNLFAQLAEASPLKPEVLGGKLDLLIVRELTSGVYFGKRERIENNSAAYDTMYYNVSQIERLLHVAFKAALKRRGHVTVVDKANILETSRLWREVTESVRLAYPDVTVEYMYVDNAAMQLVRNPSRFDVIATSNLFGDILSDEASMLAGSIGMLASASLGAGTLGMYEPIHGSAPDIAGQDIANPIATILSAAMLLRYSLGLHAEAEAVEKAVSTVLDEGWRTADIMQPGMRKAGTVKMGQLIAAGV